LNEGLNMALTYYLMIDGINGGVTSSNPQLQGAFAVSSYNFDIQAALSANGSPSQAEFSPLTVNLDLTTGLTSLLGRIASAQRISSVRLQGVNADGVTLYDLKLGNVIITGYKDTNTGLDSLTFDYLQFSLSNQLQNPNSTLLSAPLTQSWDLIRNQATGVNISNPVPSNANALTGGGGAVTYYLKIDGMNGGSTNPQHLGAFEISSYDFDISNTPDVQNGRLGRPEFSPFKVKLNLTSGLTSLLSKMTASPQPIPAIRLEGVTSTGVTVYDLKFGDVTITDYNDTNSGLDTLTFGYQRFSLTTTPINPNGNLGSPVTQAWDLLANRGTGVTITNPTPASGGSTGGSAIDYFLTIDNINGGSVQAGFQGAFDISDYTFDISKTFNFDTGTAQPASFPPLTVNLEATGLTALINRTVNGELMPSVRLQGVSRNGGIARTVYDLKLGDVFLTKYYDSSSGLDRLAFDYQKFSLTTTPQNPNGSLGQSVTQSWDRTTNRETGVNIPNPVPDTAFGGGQQLTYYLMISGINGGVTSTNRELQGAFAVSSYNFDIQTVLTANGRRTSAPEFSPLTVNLDLTSGLTALIGNIANGQSISSVRLQGVNANGVTLYDLKLGNVLITSYDDTNNGQDSLKIDFRQFSLATTPVDTNGSLGSTVTQSWDRVRNQGTGVNIPNPSQASAFSSGGGGAVTYYLMVDGVNGGSTNAQHRGAFEISSYDFKISNPLDIQSGNAGRPLFSPLTVNLNLTSGLTGLLSKITSPRTISAIRLEGVTSDGTTVYDLKLGDVTITRYADNNGLDSLDFGYRQFSLTTTPINSNGSLGRPVTQSWDLDANRAGVNIPNPVSPSGNSSGGGGAVAYYLMIDGLNGGSPNPQFPGAFEVSSYNFDINNTPSGGGRENILDFPPLAVNLDLTTGLSSLINRIANNRRIPSIRLQGVNANGATLYDLKLGDAFLTHYVDTNTGQDRLTFDYGQFSLTTTPINANGSLGTPVTQSWDQTRNRDGVTIPNPVPAPNTAPILATAIGNPNIVTTNSTLNYTIPAGTFSDANNDPLIYSAALANGATLPSWLTFNTTTGNFSGKMPTDFAGVLNLKVTATDPFLASAAAQFTLTVNQNVSTGSSNPDSLDGSGVPDSLIGAGGNDTLRGFDNADTLDGGVGADQLFGDNGVDSLLGGDGNDSLDGGSGNDDLFGGTGIDIIQGGAGIDYMFGEAGSDTLNGGTEGDYLDGGANADTLNGGDGNDTLLGGLDNDSLDGNAGADYLLGQDGNDNLIGSDGNDTLVGHIGTDNLLGGNDVDLLFGGDDSDTLDGGDGNDAMSGGAGNDSLLGGDGEDYMLGDTGNDTLLGGAGNDVLLGGAENDSLTGGDGNDTLFGEVGNDTLTGSDGNDYLISSDGADSLLGDLGNDTLVGETGNDTLLGGAETDFLAGGEGTDEFRFGGANEQFFSLGLDTIFDFAFGEKIALSLATFSALASGIGDGFSVVSEFATTENASTNNLSGALIVYETTTGGLFYDLNGATTGFGAGGQFATITGNPSLTATDFRIVA
jgi:type VI protein secretion system component Hcp